LEVLSIEQSLRIEDRRGQIILPSHLFRSEVALFDRRTIEETKFGQPLLRILQNIVGLIRCKIGQNQIVIGSDEKVGSSDVAVVNVEDLVDGVDCEDDLIDDPNYDYPEVYSFPPR
jgi:hypothetical protein